MKYAGDQDDLIGHAVLGYQVKRLAHQSAIADIDRKLAQLLAPAAQANVEITRPRRTGRPPKALLAAAAGKPVKSGWPADPEERSAEMKRRQAVAKENKRKTGAQSRWNKSTPAQREKWQKAMQAGLRKKKRREQSQQAVDNARRAVEQHRKQQPAVKLEATA